MDGISRSSDTFLLDDSETVMDADGVIFTSSSLASQPARAALATYSTVTHEAEQFRDCHCGNRERAADVVNLTRSLLYTGTVYTKLRIHVRPLQMLLNFYSILTFLKKKSPMHQKNTGPSEGSVAININFPQLCYNLSKGLQYQAPADAHWEVVQCSRLKH